MNSPSMCLDNEPGDPVHEHTDGTWWFWDETWTDENGPYATREKAERGARAYAIHVLGVDPRSEGEKRRDHDVLY